MNGSGSVVAIKSIEISVVKCSESIEKKNISAKKRGGRRANETETSKEKNDKKNKMRLKREKTP